MSFLRPRTASEKWIRAAWEKEGQEPDLCMWIQNYLFGITEVGQESSFDWSSAEGMNSSPLEKEASLTAAAESRLQEGHVPQRAGGTGEVRSQHGQGGGGSSRDVAGDLTSARASPVANALHV